MVHNHVLTHNRGTTMNNEDKKPRVEIRDITPELASQWIKLNHEKNRRRRLRKVVEYSVDMIRDEWPLATQVIAFDTDGKLINGQHTLEAVIRSRKTIQCIVLWNTPKKAMMVIDGGLKRSTDDHLSLAGKEYPAGCGATVRRIMLGTVGKGAISDTMVAEFMQDHHAAVAFVHRATNGNRFVSAPVRAVMTRARIKRVTQDVLTRFAEVLGTGIMSEGENAAVLLRNKIADMKTKSDGVNRSQLYGLTEAALAAFVAKEKLTKLNPAAEELFPVAEDRIPNEKFEKGV